MLLLQPLIDLMISIGNFFKLLNYSIFVGLTDHFLIHRGKGPNNENKFVW